MATEQPKSSSWEEAFAHQVPVYLDLAGLMYVEAAERVFRGAAKLEAVETELQAHQARVASARGSPPDPSDAWVDVIQGVGGLEPILGATIAEFCIADVLLVAAAEAYVNAVAAEVLGGTALEHFDKLSPTGKWLFLPPVMNLLWRPSLDSQPLQAFAALVARRNRVVHPRPVGVAGAVEVEALLKLLRLDQKSAEQGRESVRDLIRGLSLAWKGSNGPDWLNPDYAKAHPPCLFAYSIEAPMRLGWMPRPVGGKDA